MTNIDLNKPILVTGGNGYMGSWIVKFLLDAGRHVKTTVLNKSDKNRIEHILKMVEEHPGKLEIYEADLLQKGSFEEAMKDCELVIHNAAVFKMWNIKDPQKELIDPALEGTRNVLYTANKTPSVKRVVFTSTVFAVYGDSIDIEKTPNKIFTENDWNTTSNYHHLPYAFAKTLAEKEAWKIQKEQKQWDLVVVNPGFAFGPSLTKMRTSYSIEFILSFLDGAYRGLVPDIYLPIVDVRDAAKANILAGTTPNASGRHLIVTKVLRFLEIADVLREKYSEYPLPKSIVPKPLLYLIGPLQLGGFSWKFIKRNVGIPIQFDASYSVKDLGMEYSSIEVALNEHAEQIIKSGLLDNTDLHV